MTIVALLDLDGVLINPGGYHKAFQDTLKIILEKTGYKGNLPDETIIALFESMGVTNEWDMVAICLAIVLEELLTFGETIPIDLGFDELLERLIDAAQADTFIDYEVKVRQIAPFIKKDGVPPSKVLMDFVIQNRNDMLFPRLGHRKIFRQILGDTNKEMVSPSTRLFQNLVLGDQLFEQVYNQKASFVTDSYLKCFDTSLLYSTTCEFIRQLTNDKRIKLVVYSARNSYPPREVIGSYMGYAPEAEIALEVLGMNDLPLISSGRLNFLAKQVNRPLNHFLKPAPYQALAAIAAAIMGKELDALIWALDVCDYIAEGELQRTNDKQVLLPIEMHDLDIHIFEDSPNGLRSGKAIAEILSRLGASVKLRSWGISTNSIKIDALRKEGAVVKKNVNEALIHAFSHLG
jgi:hypothetical protein